MKRAALIIIPFGALFFDGLGSHGPWRYPCLFIAAHDFCKYLRVSR